MLINQIASNLVSNSCKFTAVGKIAVTLRLENDRFKLRVRNTGVGMSRDKVDKVWMLNLIRDFPQNSDLDLHGAVPVRGLGREAGFRHDFDSNLLPSGSFHP